MNGVTTAAQVIVTTSLSNNFLAGILIGLLIGGSFGTLAMALVAAGADRRSHRAPKPTLPTG